MYRKLLLCIILLSTAFISYAQEKKLVFNKDGYFKIVQFTDVHYKYDDQANSQIALDRINEVLDAEHPDFVNQLSTCFFEGTPPAKATLPSITTAGVDITP